MTNEWKPIETAPIPDKPNSESNMILVWNGKEVLPCVIKNYGPFTYFEDYTNSSYDGDYGEVTPRATHWMPLPSGPAQ